MPLFQTEKLNIPSNLLSNKYIVPPFSIINTITQNWQKRKDRWEYLGIASEEGRDVKRYNAMPVNTFSARGVEAKDAERTSIFDPALCEVVYKWFGQKQTSDFGKTVIRSKPAVIDPFAGGSVRGIVANALGFDYVGIDISESQIRANLEQLEAFKSKYGENGHTEWIIGDSTNIIDLVGSQKFDMLFTCPPYYNLEKYSKDERDLSNKATYSEFLDAYCFILSRSYYTLKENSFAVIVVSEVRNPKTGAFYGLVPDTIKAMQYAGFKYYNEIILENNIGSLPIRAPKYFERSRKIGRQHQNILVFYKGDTNNIEDEFGPYRY